MAETREEIAAELVWRYVEYIREETAAGRAAAFSRDELHQLMRALETASHVPEALLTEPCPTALSAARDRLNAFLDDRPPSVPATPPPPSPTRRTVRLPRWALAAGAATLLVL